MTERSFSGPGHYRGVLDSSFAARYGRGRDSWTEEPAMRRVVDVVLPDLAPGANVLDVGAGRGRDTRILLAAGHSVTAVDLVAVPEWGEITGRWGDRVRFRTGYVADLGITGEFDAVLDNGCLHHQHPGEYRSYLGALRAALRPAGLLAVSFFVLQPGTERGVLHLEDDGRLAREFTEEEATVLIGGTGFAVVGAQRIQRARPERAYLVVTARRAGN